MLRDDVFRLVCAEYEGVHILGNRLNKITLVSLPPVAEGAGKFLVFSLTAVNLSTLPQDLCNHAIVMKPS